jgi:hypothetical protein
MTRGFRGTGRALPWVLAFSLAFVSAATCLMGAPMTEAAKACCAGMNHDCGEKGVEQDCCVADSPNLPGLAPGLLVAPLAPPALVFVTTLAAQPQPTPSFVARAAFGHEGPHRSSRPTYLVVSVFRL